MVVSNQSYMKNKFHSRRLMVDTLETLFKTCCSVDLQTFDIYSDITIT